MNTPPFVFQKLFTGTGTYNFLTAEAVATMKLRRSITKWSLQVTGVDASGAVVAAPTSWTVNLQGSLDGLSYGTAAMLTHTNTVNANGDVVDSAGNFKPRLGVQINVSALTLGPAAGILVTVEGAP